MHVRTVALLILPFALSCSGLTRGLEHELPDSGRDVADIDDREFDTPTRELATDGRVDEVNSASDTATDATDTDVPDADTLKAPETIDVEVHPGTLRHIGWFGPGATLTGNNATRGFGSLSGPRQALAVP